MTEISYITQNGQQVNLKDAAGRELLATKQNKLKAGNGISIAADGTISATGAGGKKKIYAAYNHVEENYTRYCKLLNYEDFEKGKHYKVTAYFPMLKKDIENIYVNACLMQGGSWWDPSYVSEMVESGMDIEEAFVKYQSSQNGFYHSGVSGWSPRSVSLIDKNKQYYGSYGEEIEGPYLLYGDNYGESSRHLKISNSETSQNRLFPKTAIIICPDFEYYFNKVGQNIDTICPYEEGDQYYNSREEYERAAEEINSINLDDHSVSMYIADQPELQLQFFATKNSSEDKIYNPNEIFDAEGTNWPNCSIILEFEEI